MKYQNSTLAFVLLGLAFTVCFDALGEDEILVNTVVLAAIEEIEVPAREAGVLAEQPASEGAIVQAGQLLARIDDTESQLDIQRAETELAHARRNAENDIKVRVACAAAKVAGAELQRAHEARKKYPDSVSIAEIDHLQLASEHAKLQIEQAEFELETARLAMQLQQNALDLAKRQLQRHRIESPTAGRVVQIFHQCGEWVEPGQSVARILKLDRVKAIGHLDIRWADANLTGRPVQLQITSAEGTSPMVLTGKIAFVHSEVNPVDGQLDFWAEIENPDLKLRPGQKASLVIQPKRGR